MRELFCCHTVRPDGPTAAIIAVPVPDLDTEERPRFYLLPDLYHWQRGSWVTNVGDRPLTVERFWWIDEVLLLAPLEAEYSEEMRPVVEQCEPCANHCSARGFGREMVKMRSALSTACAQRDAYRSALLQIAGLRAGAGNSKLHRALHLAATALNDDEGTVKESLPVAASGYGSSMEAR